MKKQVYTFEKNIRGGVHFTLQSFDNSLPEKMFKIPHNIDRIVIPYIYALGLFISSTALKMFQDGYFTIKESEDLIGDATTAGLYFDEGFKQRADKIENIKNIILANDIVGVEKLIKRGSQIDIKNLIAIARENIAIVSGGVISKIENACGVSLTDE